MHVCNGDRMLTLHKPHCYCSKLHHLGEPRCKEGWPVCFRHQFRHHSTSRVHARKYGLFLCR